MNYLAHLLLAAPTDASRIGNLLGDFAKGTPASLADRFPDEVVAGIVMHRKLDRFTDEHEAFRAARRHLAAPRRRFAGIVIDIFFDHFLTVHWDRFAPVPLSEFLADIHSLLERRRDWLDDDLARLAPRMRDEGWLHSYGSIEGLELTFARLAHRLERLAPVRRATDDLVAHYGRFEDAFHAFFPAARRYAAQLVEDAR